MYAGPAEKNQPSVVCDRPQVDCEFKVAWGDVTMTGTVIGPRESPSLAIRSLSSVGASP